jgi:hypothetical protein
MIRRAFWVSVGAAAGITGYRRATAVGRAISVRVAGDRSGTTPGPFWPPRPDQTGRGPAARPAPALPPAGPRTQPGAPARRQAPAQARAQAQWSTARMAWRTSRAVWRTQKAAIAQVRSAGRFARDVREGMDLYMNRQQGQSGPNLARAPISTSTPATSGRQPGRTDHVKDGR